MRPPKDAGRIGSSVTQSIMRTLIKDTRRDEDPREALLKYAELAERDPKFVSPAYAETQPTAIFDEEQLRREAEEEAKQSKEDWELSKIAKKLSTISKECSNHK